MYSSICSNEMLRLLNPIEKKSRARVLISKVRIKERNGVYFT